MRIKNFFSMWMVALAFLSCDPNEPDSIYVNTAPVISDYSFTVEEDIPDTQVIGKLSASDVDGQKLTYAIFEDESGLFSITENGSLSLAGGMTLDYETATKHNLTVRVFDGIVGRYSEVEIEVVNVIEGLVEDPTSFITTWDIPADNTIITIGTNLNYEYDFTIDWGDGSTEQLTQQNPHHEYQLAGLYKVAIQGQFPAIDMDNSDVTSRVSLYSIDQWGTNQWQTMERAFMGCLKMAYTAPDVPDLSLVTSMANMFANAKAFNANLNDWAVGNVINMSGLFANAVKFNGDISSWDVSNVMDMSYMFNNADSFNGNIDSWDVEGVTKMQYMFAGASSFNGNLSDWNVFFTNNMEAMFASAKSFNGDISNWEIPNVTNLFGMFVDAFAFDRSLGSWYISDVGNMQQMLDGSGMSRESYEATLKGWSDLADNLGLVMGPRTLGAVGLEYCSEEGMLAHDNLINTHGWTINGDSQQCN
ncbi:MAG: BspA family leucine-rich repeat surface protein [Muricauda sp.]|nr:BspA family leucine-rich repeat surface protein [Allomuricauda sp.]